MKDKEVSNIAIGIDIGTSYSRVGVWVNDQVEIIGDSEGNREIPSYVSFTENELLIGYSAMEQMNINPQNTIYDIKRLIGRNCSKYSNLQKYRKEWGFEVEFEESGLGYIVIKNWRGKDRIFYAEEVLGILIHKLHKMAEEYMGKSIKNAVISVPVYFTDSQREAIKDAGVIAGLNVLRLINSTTGISVGYRLDKQKEKEKNIVVLDIGGGSLDISILNLDEGIYEVRSVGGNAHLGGRDLDTRIIQYCIGILRERGQIGHWLHETHETHETSPKLTPGILNQLRVECEIAKCSLSEAECKETMITLHINGNNLYIPLTRNKLETLCADLLEKCLPPLDTALQDAQMNKTQIEEVILIGGVARMPMLRRIVQEYFGRELVDTEHLMYGGVVYGAAIQAAILTGTRHSLLDEVLCLDVIPLTIGLQSPGGVMKDLIKRNNTIPMRVHKTYTTSERDQSELSVPIYEGERSMVKDNNLLGIIRIWGILPAPAGLPQLEVTFDIDANGIMHLSVEEKGSGRYYQVQITLSKGRLNKSQMESANLRLTN